MWRLEMVLYNGCMQMFQWKSSSREHSRGFTLIELLAVIAIIGILSSTVLASISAARQKSRDAKRIAEVRQIGRAMELYYDTHQSYPSTTPAGYSGTDAGVQFLVTVGFFPEQPIPPLGLDTAYHYHGLYTDTSGVTHECDGSAPAGTACDGFALGITLERSENSVLRDDADQQVGAFDGQSAECGSTVAGDELCYDIEP